MKEQNDNNNNNNKTEKWPLSRQDDDDGSVPHPPQKRETPRFSENVFFRTPLLFFSFFSFIWVHFPMRGESLAFSHGEPLPTTVLPCKKTFPAVYTNNNNNSKKNQEAVLPDLFNVLVLFLLHYYYSVLANLPAELLIRCSELQFISFTDVVLQSFILHFKSRCCGLQFIAKYSGSSLIIIIICALDRVHLNYHGPPAIRYLIINAHTIVFIKYYLMLHFRFKSLPANLLMG
eukprot:gene2315-1452_t